MNRKVLRICALFAFSIGLLMSTYCIAEQFLTEQQMKEVRGSGCDCNGTTTNTCPDFGDYVVGCVTGVSQPPSEINISSGGQFRRCIGGTLGSCTLAGEVPCYRKYVLQGTYSTYNQTCFAGGCVEQDGAWCHICQYARTSGSSTESDYYCAF